MFGQNSFQSTNPVLANDDAFHQYYGGEAAEQANVTTLQGVVNKTGILVLIAVICGAGGYAIAPQLGWGVLLISWVISMLVVLGLYYKIYGNPKIAAFLAPPYAAIQGAFLGMFTQVIERGLEAGGYAVMGGLAFQAFIITISVMLAMLGLYYLRIIQPTQKLFAVIATLTAGIFLTYLISFVAGIFMGPLPVIHVFGAEAGTAAWIGLGFNLLVLGVAALWLIFDFALVEEKVKSGAPKYMEWFCGFALIFTLVWIYWEAVKLAARLAILFANRE
jgi:uncharacterized YccA/Bax inhibitor family protein